MKSLVSLLSTVAVTLLIASVAFGKPPQYPKRNQGPPIKDDCGCLTTKVCTCTEGTCTCWDGGVCPLVKSAKVVKACLCSSSCVCGCNQGGSCDCASRTVGMVAAPQTAPLASPVSYRLSGQVGAPATLLGPSLSIPAYAPAYGGSYGGGFPQGGYGAGFSGGGMRASSVSCGPRG